MCIRDSGLGMTLADKKLRARIEAAMKDAIASDTCPAEYKEAFQEWIDGCLLYT